MTTGETEKALEILSLAYPSAFEGMTRTKLAATAKLWHKALAKYSWERVEAAVNDYILTNEYPPTIAGLIKKLDSQTEGTDIELWNEARKHITYYITKEDFEAIPEPIKTWFGSPANIKELSQMPLDTLNTVIKGQFLKTIGTVVDRQKSQKQLENSKSHLRAILGAQAKELPDMDY